MPRTRCSTKAASGAYQLSEITNSEPSRKRKALDETGPEPKKWNHKTHCLRCSFRGIRRDRLNAHADKCRNRPAKCGCGIWHANRYDARLHSCFEATNGNDLTDGEWCDLEIQAVKLLYTWKGALENSLHLFPGRSAKDLYHTAKASWTRCPACNYAATRRTIKCSNCHSEQSPVCGICAKDKNHASCGTKEELIDTHNHCAVNDYLKTCFRYMPESALERLVSQWNPGHPNVSYEEENPNLDPHEENVAAAVLIFKNPHSRRHFLSECKAKYYLPLAWRELIMDLERLADRNTQSLSSPQGERYLPVHQFIFDQKTFKIKKEEDVRFPVIIKPQGNHWYGFEEAASKLVSVSLDYVSGYVSLGERNKKQIKLTMAPMDHGDLTREQLFCKPCRFVARSKDCFVSHNITNHPEENNPELYACLICGHKSNINSRQHECRVYSREIRFGTRELFMVYWLSFMKLTVDQLRDLLVAWDNLKSPVFSEFRKYLSSSLEIEKPTKLDLIYPLCVLLRWAIRSQEEKESPCSVREHLLGKMKVNKRTLGKLNFIFEVAQRERTVLNETREIHGMQKELEAPEVVEQFGVDILPSLESRYNPEWEQLTETNVYHRFDSSPMENTQRETIHVQTQSHEEGKEVNVIAIPSDDDTDCGNGEEALLHGEDAMSSIMAFINELGQTESESWSSRGFYLGRESKQAEGNIDDEHDSNNQEDKADHTKSDGRMERWCDPESSSDQNDGYIDGLEEQQSYHFINDIDLETPIERLKELEKDLTERHLEDLNRCNFDGIELRFQNLINLKGALRTLLETSKAVETSIPRHFSLEWTDQKVDGIDLKTPTEQLKKLKGVMEEKQCEDVRCGRLENLVLNAGRLTRLARAMEGFVPASERLQEVLATWQSHTG